MMSKSKRPGKKAAKKIKPAQRKKALSRGESLVIHTRGRGDVEITTDEVMRLTRGE